MLQTRAPTLSTRAPIARSAIAGAALVLALAIAGCGGAEDFANAERAPARITLSAAIGTRDVTVSPARIGAGTVEVLASNQTSTSQELTVRSASPTRGARALDQRTGPINPGDTASLTAELAQGTYRVTAGSRERAPATIRVGPARGGATDRLLQP